jgi:hypothetical protein
MINTIPHRQYVTREQETILYVELGDERGISSHFRMHQRCRAVVQAFELTSMRVAFKILSKAGGADCEQKNGSKVGRSA